MRFGCCVGPEQIGTLKAAGYDFCELPARAVMPFETDAAALPALREIAAAGLRPESFNVLIPAQVALVGSQADPDQLRTYLRRAFSRMVSLGAEVAVLGSGAARRLPEGMPQAEALEQLAGALELAAGEAQRAGITLALEHLNRDESNVFTSLRECQAFVEERQIPGLQLLADLHHLEVEGEPLGAVVEARSSLAHVHVADGGRRAPGEGGYNYAGFMSTLREAGYDRRISAECSWENLEQQAAGALDFMRRSWAEAL
jgi:D-psicose/D-tagatose/L-ribulose 3-epimerase